MEGLVGNRNWINSLLRLAKMGKLPNSISLTIPQTPRWNAELVLSRVNENVIETVASLDGAEPPLVDGGIKFLRRIYDAFMSGELEEKVCVKPAKEQRSFTGSFQVTKQPEWKLKRNTEAEKSHKAWMVGAGAILDP